MLLDALLIILVIVIITLCLKKAHFLVGYNFIICLLILVQFLIVFLSSFQNIMFTNTAVTSALMQEARDVAQNMIFQGPDFQKILGQT